MDDRVVGRNRDAYSVRARELVHELITAHVLHEPDAFAVTCTAVFRELEADRKLLAAYLVESAAYTHTVLSAIASGLDSEVVVDDESVVEFHRAMIGAWSRSAHAD
jgi:hypothetical protein